MTKHTHATSTKPRPELFFTPRRLPQFSLGALTAYIARSAGPVDPRLFCQMPPSASMRAFSPTMSTASSVAGLGNIMPSRIVHKLAIEGHCRANAEGATLRLYMKVGRSGDVFRFHCRMLTRLDRPSPRGSYCRSLHSTLPRYSLCSQHHFGLILIIFTEENVRIVNSKVHPLDSSSTPYAFSSTAVPLLHRTARALSLPARSNKSYYAFLGIPPPPLTSPAEGSPRRSSNSAPLPVTVTGTFGTNE